MSLTEGMDSNDKAIWLSITSICGAVVIIAICITTACVHESIYNPVRKSEPTIRARLVPANGER